MGLPDWLGEEEAVAGAATLEDARLRIWHHWIPQRFHRACLADAAPDVYADLHEWSVDTTGRNLILLGPVGVGKTWHACAALRPAVLAGLTVAFVPVVDLLDCLRPDGDRQRVEGLTDVDRLLLDDLGTEKVSEWTLERIYAIVNARWLAMRPTVVTSNLPANDLAERLGERTFSRLVGNDSIVLHLGGPDQRRKRR